jgi:radical SAM protein with 4Fe4S-binding SPASM domain
LTNGTLVNAGNAARIAAFSDRIKISLDGSTDEIHAMTRGRRNHAKVVAAIDLFAGLGTNVQVAMTVHKGNRHDINAMTKRYGAMLTFQPLFPAGRAAKRDDLQLSGSEYYEALASVENVAPMAAIGSVLERLRGRGVKRCALAETEISISETGDVYPCQLLTSPEFLAGNVRDNSLKHIYYHSPVLTKARAVSVETLEKCQTCPIRLLCAGACRARDYYEIGAIDRVGNFCEYEQQAFLQGMFDSAEFDVAPQKSN